MSPGGKYVFATVICLVLPMCILTSCSSVLFVLMAMGMFVCESYVVLDEPSSLFVFPVYEYGGIVGYFWCLAFCVIFVCCIVMMFGWVFCTRFFSSSILFLIPFMLI